MKTAENGAKFIENLGAKRTSCASKASTFCASTTRRACSAVRCEETSASSFEASFSWRFETFWPVFQWFSVDFHGFVQLSGRFWAVFGWVEWSEGFF